MSMLFDPMVKWPEIPTISSRIQFFIDDGIILCGGNKGPFKLTGKMAVKDTCDLLYKLKHNSLAYPNFIKKLSSEENSNNLLYVLTKLHANGFLSDRSASSFEEEYYDQLNQNVKNFDSVREILSLKSQMKVKLSINKPLVLNAIKEIFELNHFNIVDDESFDWQLMEVDSNTNLSSINERKQTFLFSITDKGYTLGPIVSKNAIRVNELGFYSKVNFGHTVDHSTLYDIYLTMMKTMLRLNDFYLDQGLVEYTDYEFRYIDKVELIGEDRLSIIENYEITSAFSSPKYQNKSNHLAHYREGNVRLGKKEFLSDFWKPTDYFAPDGLKETFLALAGFKQDIVGKKMSPTGGNINANLLFYLNVSSNDLEGIGSYYFDNITGKMYQIDDNLSMFTNLINKGNGKNSYLILASNVDYIETKYHDFSFKIANLNTGVQLATLFSIKKPAKVCQFNVINHFEEADIKEALGISMNKVIINAILEVEKND